MTRWRTLHTHLDPVDPPSMRRSLTVEGMHAEHTTGEDDLIRVRVDAPGERAVSITINGRDWTLFDDAITAFRDGPRPPIGDE